MKKLTVLLIMYLTLACGVATLPATPTATEFPATSTRIFPPTKERRLVSFPATQEVGVVVTDGLTVRQCPVGLDAPAITNPDPDCQPAYYIERGAAVMGDCNYHFEPDIWLNMDGGKMVAVVWQGTRFIEGVCACQYRGLCRPTANSDVLPFSLCHL